MSKSRIGSNPLDSIIPPGGENAESQRAGEPASQHTSKTHSDQPGEAGQKVKATFYLAPEVEEALEATWMQLRRITGRKVSKSELVEAALKALASDVAQKGARSPFVRDLR